MENHSEAYGSLTSALEDVLRTSEGVPAHIKADVLMRLTGQQKKLATASQGEGAGQSIKSDPVNQREQTNAAPTDGGKPQDTVQGDPVPNDAQRNATNTSLKKA